MGPGIAHCGAAPRAISDRVTMSAIAPPKVFAALGDATWSRLFRAKARRDEAAALVSLVEACGNYKDAATATLAGAASAVAEATQQDLRAVAVPLYESFLRHPRKIPALPMGLRRCVPR